jgi:type I restriction-modification system DNA methylase subunit
MSIVISFSKRAIDNIGISDARYISFGEEPENIKDHFAFTAPFNAYLPLGGKFKVFDGCLMLEAVYYLWIDKVWFIFIIRQMTDKREYWQINTEKLANDIKAIANLPDIREEDLKMKIEPLLQNIFKKMGVDVEIVRHEKTATTYGGRTDTVYGYLTIEYKSPGKLSHATEVKKVTEQLERYLSEQAEQFGAKSEDFLEKAVGIAIDGRHILFIRFSKISTLLPTPVPIEEEQVTLFPKEKAARGFQISGPYPITPSSLTNLLIFVRASALRPLTAKDLATVFAPECQIARQTVSELYSELMKAQLRHGPSRVKAFFIEWDRIFGVIYGQELEKAEKTAEETAKLYQMPAGSRLKELLFSIHTFYAFLLKIIAIELISLQREKTVESFVRGLAALDDDALRERLVYLESGHDFITKGIENFLEADFFSWYLDAWTSKIANVFRDKVRALADFEPATPVLEPEWTKDLLQKLYEVIVPQKLRHDLGEYYTPDWLAGYVLEKSGYCGDIGTRFLDPACGSGTFLVQAINKTIKRNEHSKKVKPEVLARNILDNIVGFDLNPVAVLAARTNYLIAFLKYLRYVRPITIPVYLCDSVMAPSRYEEEGKLPFNDDEIVFTTTKGDYVFPVAMQNKSRIDRFTTMLDVALRGKLELEQFERQVKNEFKFSPKETALLTTIYQQIKKLDEDGENGIWARYIKNAFAPVYLDKFDYVIGNPPWIRWDFLSDDYRKRTLNLWQKYGLFSLKGYEARLGGGKKDFSMLFTYACADNYLKDNGILGFVITMEVFKSKGAGEGFRRFGFKYNDVQASFKVLSMEDMVNLMPFQAANKTSVFWLKKCSKTTYPLPVLAWKRKPKVGKIRPEWSIDEVKANCEIRPFKAIPINPDKITGAWQTASPDDLKLFLRLNGRNQYTAHSGAVTDPYGVFRLKIKEARPDGKIWIQNMYERGKREIKSVSTSIESDLVFPSVCGGDIIKYGIKNNFYLLVPQNPKEQKPYSAEWMLKKFPLTYAYLKQFENILLSRGSGPVRELAKKTEFYAVFGIGEYTFSKYRTTWKQGSSKMVAAVLSAIKTDLGTKPMIPTHTAAFFSVDDKSEAHYLCAILNSEIVNNFIKSFSAAGRGFGTPSVMENLAIPKFNGNKRLHHRLAELSEEAHELVKKGKPIAEIEQEINSLVEELWNIKS